MNETLFATVATADRIEAGLGIIWWATHPPGDYALTVVDYDVCDVAAVNAAWLGDFFTRSGELVEKHKPARRGCLLRVEQVGVADILRRADDAYRDTPQLVRAIDRCAYDIRPIKQHESAKWPATLDERAFAIRPRVDSGKVVKLETGLRRLSFRAVRTNHLISQIRQHRPGDAASAGELLHAFVLGVLLGTSPKTTSWFDQDRRPLAETSAPSSGPFGPYIHGRRPW